MSFGPSTNSGQVQTYILQVAQDIKIFHSIIEIFEQIPGAPKFSDLVLLWDLSSLG